MSKINLKNIIAYCQGNIRYKLYYSRFDWLIPKHIKEQIDIRINSMNKQCYKDGSCIACGCSTTALQMADKSCNKNCYPVMLSYEYWITMKKIDSLLIDGILWELKMIFGVKKFIKWNGKKQK